MSGEIVFDLFNAAEVYKNIDKVASRIKLIKPAMKAFGEDVRRNIIKNMVAGQGFNGTPFVELSPLTIMSRRKGSSIPLSDNGVLKNSIGVRMDTDISVSIVAGLKKNLIYARLHQYGGIIKAKKKYLTIPINPAARNRKASSFNDLFFYPNKRQEAANPGRWKSKFLARMKGSGKKAKLELMYLLKPSVKVPARPYMGFSDDAPERLRQTVIKMLTTD